MLLTRCNPSEAEKLRKLIAGERDANAARKPKAPKAKSKRAVQLVEQAVVVHTNGIWLTLPLYLSSAQYNAGGARWLKAATAKQHIEFTLKALRGLLPTHSSTDHLRESFRGVTFARLSPSTLDDDNVQPAFKHIRDATFAWIVNGDRNFNRRAIGHFDATVKQGRHYVCYEQCKNEAHGIQIRLHV